MTAPEGGTEVNEGGRGDSTPAGRAAAALHERLRESGAEVGRVRGGRSVLSYGDVEKEYAALRETVGLVDDADRRLLEIRGPSAREHFGGLVTNHVEALEPGRGVYAFMLTPRGRPVAEMRVLAREPEDGDEVLWADMPAACADQAVEHLGRYLPPRLARHEPVEDVVRVGLVGPASAATLESLGAGEPPDGELSFAELDVAALSAPLLAVRREEIEGPGFDLHLSAGDLSAAWDLLLRAASEGEGRASGLRAREAWRVERGVPVYGPEINTDVLPQETGQTGRAVDIEKGCYTGQEVVARIHYRGKVNRRLLGLVLHPDLPVLPGNGDELFLNDRARGTVTTAVRSPRLGPVALAYVRTEVEPGDTLALEPGGEPACRVLELPLGE